LPEVVENYVEILCPACLHLPANVPDGNRRELRNTEQPSVLFRISHLGEAPNRRWNQALSSRRSSRCKTFLQLYRRFYPDTTAKLALHPACFCIIKITKNVHEPAHSPGGRKEVYVDMLKRLSKEPLLRVLPVEKCGAVLPPNTPAQAARWINERRFKDSKRKLKPENL